MSNLVSISKIAIAIGRRKGGEREQRWEWSRDNADCSYSLFIHCIFFLSFILYLNRQQGQLFNGDTGVIDGGFLFSLPYSPFFSLGTCQTVCFPRVVILDKKHPLYCTREALLIRTVLKSFVLYLSQLIDKIYH